MPTYATANLPPEMESVVHTFGINQARLAIILALKERPATIPNVAKQTGLTHMTVNRHLLDLEGHGSVVASMPPTDPGRRRAAGISWTLQLDHVQQELKELCDLLR